ncbi:hypothetical protein H0H92_000656 [Tricholoma furcatifolium]|nr:hypothetical protein H0H92_000656 [Tricholoma furcatifolium]
MNSTTTLTYSSPRLHPTAPPLCSAASVLDAFVVEGAVAYASTATSLEVHSDSLATLLARQQYFLEVFQRESSYRENVLQCQPQDAQRMLDAMQDLLTASWTDAPFQAVLEVALSRLAQEHRLYPTRLVLEKVFSEKVFSEKERLPLRITVGEVIRGSFNGAVVGIKTSGLSLEDSAGIISKHILSWTFLKHENVLPLHGVCTITHYNEDGPFNCLGLVFPFLENGNVTEFLDKHPATDRRSLILDVAAGMSYLHENGIVHGRIHCQNILITNTLLPRACLADFGFTNVIGPSTGFLNKYTFDNPPGTRVNYLLVPEDDISTNWFSQTEASDVYAFSTASHEILMGELPSISVRFAMALWPSSPEELGSQSENMMQQLLMDCWHQDANKRPSARQIIEGLKNVIELDKRAQEEKALRVEENIQRSLTVILNNVEYHRRLISLDRSTTQRILDAFQLVCSYDIILSDISPYSLKLLDRTKLQQCRTQVIAAMRRISENSGQYPARFSLDDNVTQTVGVAVAAGSFADIYKVLFRGKYLCLKMVRMTQYNHLAKVGISSPSLEPALITFSLLTTLFQCSDTAAGVEYLHKNDVVHGDLKGANVLIDASGRAALGDFGLSSVTDPQILQWTSQSTVESKGGTTRWQAPELLRTDIGPAHNTKASDVFAWGSVCYEIFTGRLPYFESSKARPIMKKILGGVTPTRPEDSDIAWQQYGLNSDIWDLMQDCWKFEASERLNMTKVILRLNVVKPVDARPPMEWKEFASIHFRNAETQNLPLSFWGQLDDLLLPIISPSS